MLRATPKATTSATATTPVAGRYIGATSVPRRLAGLPIAARIQASQPTTIAPTNNGNSRL